MLREGFETFLNAEFRPGKAGAKGERCTGGFRVLDLAKRWQRAKAAQRVLGPWSNVLRAGFETLYMQYFDVARQGLRAMAKRWQGGLKLDGRVSGPGGTCFAQVLKPS